MTKKRFTYEYDEYAGNLFDNKMNTFYHIEDSDENIEILCDRLNWLVEENEQLKTQLQEIQNSFEFNCTQNYEEFNKDKLYLKDTNTKLCLDGENLFIEVYISQINEYYRFKYRVTGRSLMREFIENYNSKEDLE